MQKSKNINELVTAMVEAKKKFTPLLKTGSAKITTTKGGQYEYDYIELATILDMINPILSECGLWVSQEEIVVEGALELTTWFFHSSGQFIEWSPVSLPIISTGNIVQAIGSTITYARRYDLITKLGLAGEKDTDGSDLIGKPIADVATMKAPKARGKKPEVFQDDPLPEPTKGKPASEDKEMIAKRKVVIDEIAEVLKSPVFTDADKEMMKRNIHESGTLELLGTLKSQCLEVEKIRNAKAEQGE